MGGWCCGPRRIEKESVTSARKEIVVSWDNSLKHATVRASQATAEKVVVWQPLRDHAANRDVGGIKENKNDQKLLPEGLAREQETEDELVNSNRELEMEWELVRLHHPSYLSGHSNSLEDDFNRVILEKNVGMEELPLMQYVALSQGPWGRGNAKEQLSYLFHLCGTTDIRSIYVHSPTSVSAVSFRELMDMGEWIYRWSGGEFMIQDYSGLKDGLAFAVRLFTDIKKGAPLVAGEVTKEECVEMASSYDDIVAIVTRRTRRPLEW